MKKNNNLRILIKSILKEEIEKNTNPVIEKELAGDQYKDLRQIYYEIEKELGDKFTQKHFDDEKKYSGELKVLANGLDPDTLESFKTMKKDLKIDFKYRRSSYRTWEDQKNIFLMSANKRGGTIKGGLFQAALPGFSQHHTGKALDITPTIKPTTLKKYGFSLPYPNQTDFRMAEPWHINYDGQITFDNGSKLRSFDNIEP